MLGKEDSSVWFYGWNRFDIEWVTDDTRDDLINWYIDTSEYEWDSEIGYYVGSIYLYDTEQSSHWVFGYNSNLHYDAEIEYRYALLALITEYDPVTYTISFEENGADDGEMESIEATYDEEYTLTANAYTREGYTFSGWNTEADGSGTSYEDEATVSNLTTTDGDTVTLYAQWTEEETSYSLNLDVVLGKQSTSTLTTRKTSISTQEQRHEDIYDQDKTYVANYSFSSVGWTGFTPAGTALVSVDLLRGPG